MTSKKQSGKLQAQRIVNECLRGLYISDKNPIIRGQIAKIVAIRSPDKVVEAILIEDNISTLRMMLQGLEDVKYEEVDDLVALLKSDDRALAERVFQMFANVGRADLLFGLAVGGDDKTIERVKRYLHEQNWLK
jgi:hypothetical protein